MINLYLLQDFLLREGPESLEKKFSIKFKQHPDYPNLYQFNYSQIDSDLSNPMVQICRGIILDKDHSWGPVCWGYNKFFNYKEPLSVKIEWKKCHIYEKADGSLIQLYNYDSQWHVATSGTPDGNCKVNNGNVLFKDLFWETWDKLEYEYPLDPNLTYLFELCCKENKIIVQYKQNNIMFHGARNRETGYEILPTKVCKKQRLNYNIVNKFKFNNIEEILEYCKGIKGTDLEGFVVCDKYFNRVKIKCEDYIKLHHCISNMSETNILSLIQTNETCEYLAYFPEWEYCHKQRKKEYESFLTMIETEYEKFKSIDNQKDFALKVKDLPYSGAFFAIRSKKYNSFKDYYSSLPVKKLEEVMKLVRIKDDIKTR